MGMIDYLPVALFRKMKQKVEEVLCSKKKLMILQRCDCQIYQKLTLQYMNLFLLQLIPRSTTVYTVFSM